MDNSLINYKEEIAAENAVIVIHNHPPCCGQGVIMQTKNLTKAQKMLIKTLKSGTSTLDDIRSHFHVRTVSSLVKRDIIQINVKPIVKIK